ncbi:MAG TPA: alpha-isopropylmalate synthase regulatory domain-containing protein, partial [Limnochordia bacterium]|nr:alpha-isopropylmalate synthase regulatory domain-containing protein [Limnochordia bacterium]
AHKGGAHVSAILRHPETYEHIPPESVGNQRRVLVSELSGASNVIYKARDYGIELSKDSPALRKVVNTIKELEHQGYHFEGAEASFELILKKALGLYQPYFELVGLRLTVDKRDPLDEPVAEATIKVKVGEHILHTAADGNGPVNALDSALRKALETVYPQIRRIKLVDYKVRVLNERAGTAAKVRVLIRSSDDGKSWGTVGVSTNIIEASWRALVDSIEYGLMRANVAVEAIKVSRPV